MTTPSRKLSAPKRARATGNPDMSVRWLPARMQNPGVLRRLALASVVVNVIIVVTGGAVRLTGSGLGCPTWPRCNENSLTPTRENALHGVIEFTNRQLTFVVALVVFATWVLALVLRRERALATAVAASIPAQAVLGGITVLTDLNPWVVAAHFLLSMVIIAAALLLWTRLRSDPPRATVPTAAQRLAWLTLASAAASLAIGTVVTGSGPHAGDKVEGKVHRTGLQVSSMAQLHADSVMVLVGLSIGLVVLAYALHTPDRVRKATLVLLGVELAQGAIGYTQYFLHVPPVLVGLHMLGACLVWIAALQVLLAVHTRALTSQLAAPGGAPRGQL